MSAFEGPGRFGTPDAKRRTVLVGMGTAALGAILARLADSAARKPDTLGQTGRALGQAGRLAPPGDAYHVTEHIRRYYRTARY